MIVLDNSTLVAYSKASDRHHHDALAVIAANRDRLVAHSLTIAEFMVYPVRMAAVESAWELLTSPTNVGGLGIQVLDALGHRWPIHLARIRERTRLKMPDAVVLATALATGGVVSTFDTALYNAAQAEGAIYRQDSSVIDLAALAYGHTRPATDLDSLQAEWPV